MRRAPWLAAPLVVLAAAGGAVALPDEPPVTPLSPADGAVVGTNPAGIAISYRCPRYTSYVDLLTGVRVTEGSDHYIAGVSTSSATGADGRLANTISLTSVVPIGDDLEVCQAAFGGLSSYTEPRPHRVPGTYHWQVWRECSDCAAGWEVGPVWRFTVRLGAALTVRAPAVAFAGIPVLVPVRFAGVGRSEVRLQRRSGTGWTTVAVPLLGGLGDVARDEAPLIARLPGGVQRLRAVVSVGGQTVTSPEVAVRVRPARAWSPGAAAAGAYRDPSHPSLRFTIGHTGRTLDGFSSHVTATCPGSGVPTVVDRIIAVPSARIAPDGRFVLGTRAAGQSVWLQGRLTRTGVTGYAAWSGSGCSGDLAFRARRSGG